MPDREEGVRITVPMVPPSINKMRHMHFHDYRRLRDRWESTMYILMGHRQLSELRQRPVGKVHVQMHIEHTRLFDPDGLYSAVKIPLDCLVRLEIIPNDTPENLTLSVTQAKSKEKQTTIVIDGA